MSKLIFALLASVLAITSANSLADDPDKNPALKKKKGPLKNMTNCLPKDRAAGSATNLLLCLPPKAQPTPQAESEDEWAGVPREKWSKMTDAEKAQRKQDEWQRKWTGVPRDEWDQMTDAEKSKAFEKAKTAGSKDPSPK